MLGALHDQQRMLTALQAARGGGGVQAAAALAELLRLASNTRSEWVYVYQCVGMYVTRWHDTCTHQYIAVGGNQAATGRQNCAATTDILTMMPGLKNWGSWQGWGSLAGMHTVHCTGLGTR
jgi:hypothetical protein